MKILHVVSGLQKASGVTTFVENVVSELRALGHEVDVLTRGEVEGRVGVGERTLRDFDVVHVHGLWDPWLLKIAGKVPRGRLVWSTHGMTAPWSLKHKWWKKCLVWWLWQKPLLKRAAVIHSTVEKEREWNERLGLGVSGSGRSVVVPLGTYLPKLEVRSRSVECRTLLFVGRVYPVKAIDRLIEAFARIIHLGQTSLYNSWTLRIVGPDQAGHMAELMQLCENLGLSYSNQDGAIHSTTTTNNYNSQPQVEFVGPKFDDELQAEYANCDILALVSHTENFGATVVDAMAHGKPVITSTNTPWREVAEIGTGWWVDNDVEILAATLRSAFNIPTSTLEAMSKRGRKLIESEYTWLSVTKKLEQAYTNAIMK